MSKASLELGGGNWGTKDGNLLAYAQGNESSKFVPREFTFTRGSDIAATRVNSSGVIEKYRENLLLQSNQFDTSPWVSSSVTLTSGQSGYDGSTDAWLLTKNGTGFKNVYQYINELGVATLTVHAKAGSTNWMRLTHGGKTAYFDLSGSGAIGVTSNGIDQTITSVGNGWFKCTLTANRTVAGQVPIYPYTAEGDQSGSTDSIYIQDVQLEKGLVATSYLDSGATKATSGVADNEPRIDYAGGTASLLLEPSRTNLITNSEYLDSHSKNSSTLVNFSNVTCPIKGVKVSQIIDANNGGNGRLALFEGINLTASTTYTASIFAKADQLNFIYFSFDGVGVGNLDKRVWFNLSTGQVGTTSGSATGSIESLGDGWYRCIMVFTADNTGLVNTKIAPAEEDNNINVDRDGTSSVFVTAMQLEEGSYPTSYIPTYGTSVTRSEDSFQNSTNDKPLGAIGQGTWFVELQKIGDDTNQAMYLAPTSSNTQQIRLHFDSSNARFRDAVNGYATIGTSLNVKTSLNKMALSIDTTSGIAKVYGNGLQLGSNYTLQANPFEFSRIVAEGKGFILKQSLFFPTALSDRELVDLTSLYSTYQELVTAEGLTWESPTCTTNSITELQSI